MPFATLDSLRKKEAEGNDDVNEYYAGGAGGSSGAGGGSGLAVVGPGGGGEGGENPLERIIARARGQGQGGAGGESGGAEGARVASVTFYSNGFTVDDGPLREPGIAENDAFLASVAEGYCPRELVENGKPATIHITDKRGEAYKAPPPPSYVAFSGDGQTLRSSNVGSEGDVVFTPRSPPPETPIVDASKPTVRVQLRFPGAGNKRIVAKLNADCTVSDLISVVERSGHVSGPFKMMTASRGGKPEPISVEKMSMSVKDAGLANSSITVSDA